MVVPLLASCDAPRRPLWGTAAAAGRRYILPRAGGEI
jgi:hypothetical protein